MNQDLELKAGVALTKYCPVCGETKLEVGLALDLRGNHASNETVRCGSCGVSFEVSIKAEVHW